jgi:2-polyprenyl-3-methyl-5-hydroxy-6-metoxy-1,4-benzoquinol methylase
VLGWAGPVVKGHEPVMEVGSVDAQAAAHEQAAASRPAPEGESAEAARVAERLMAAAVGTLDILVIALGDRLGYYRLLAGREPLTAPSLAAASRTAPRYAREWLEQQAVTGLLEVLDPGQEPDARRYRLRPGVAAVLADPDQLTYLAPLARQLAAAARQLPALAQAYCSGDGVPWAAQGPDMRESEADMNRPGYLRLLAGDWLAALPEVQRRLRTAPPARVADIGCGAGWSCIGLARGYPMLRVDGYDLDAASVELARHNIAAASLADRVRVHQADITTTTDRGPYDLVTAFECLHDLPHPVPALTAMRRLAGRAGTVLIADMNAAHRFTAPGDDLERLLYGFSLLICLPDSMSTSGSAATGTVLRPDTVRDYAAQAGYTRIDTLPIEHDMWRFYHLHP